MLEGTEGDSFRGRISHWELLALCSIASLRGHWMCSQRCWKHCCPPRAPLQSPCTVCKVTKETGLGSVCWHLLLSHTRLAELGRDRHVLRRRRKSATWPFLGYCAVSESCSVNRGGTNNSEQSEAGPSHSRHCTTFDRCWIPEGSGLNPQTMLPCWTKNVVVTTNISRMSTSKLRQTGIQTVWHLQPIQSGAGGKLLLWVVQQRCEAGSPTFWATTLARRLRCVQLTLLHLPFSCKYSEGFIFPNKKGKPRSTC